MADVKMLGTAILGVTSGLSTDIMLQDYPRRDELNKVKPAEFYPLDLYISLVDHLEKKLGRGSMLALGRSVAKNVIDVSLKPLNLKSVEEAIQAVQKAHESFCQPVQGEFRILETKDHYIKLRYTAPYNCILQEGLFTEIANKYGGKLVQVSQVECRRDGKPACIFDIRWISA